MESGYYSSWWSDDSYEFMDNEDERKALDSLVLGVPHIRTPIESMEMLARSTSITASEVRKGLSNKQKQYLGDETVNSTLELQQSGRSNNSISSRRGSFGKWFNQKDFSNSSLKKKDRIRVANAHIHSAVSIAGLAAALAAVTAVQKSNGSKMDLALASATELLASHCLDVAESSGADSDRVDSVVRSAMDVKTPGDLLTLTAAAATALRGEAALKARFPNESKKKKSTKSRYIRRSAERQDGSTFQCPPMVGELLQVTPKGTLQCKKVSVYVNKKTRVMVKVRGKQAGAFTKKNKCVVYVICDEGGAGRTHRKEREGSEEEYFGLSTAQGLMEFKCKDKFHRQRWVDGIKDLLSQVSTMDQPSKVHALDSLSDDQSTM